MWKTKSLWGNKNSKLSFRSWGVFRPNFHMRERKLKVFVLPPQLILIFLCFVFLMHLHTHTSILHFSLSMHVLFLFTKHFGLQRLLPQRLQERLQFHSPRPLSPRCFFQPLSSLPSFSFQPLSSSSLCVCMCVCLFSLFLLLNQKEDEEEVLEETTAEKGKLLKSRLLESKEAVGELLGLREGLLWCEEKVEDEAEEI